MLRRHSFTTTAAVAIALCAPASAAAISPDAIDAGDKGNPTATQPDLRAPDNRFGQPTSGTVVPVRVPTRVRIVEVASSGFEWGDAGIGAAGMLGIVALGTGAGLAGAQRRRSRRITATR
jgi:hypothetical protein